MITPWGWLVGILAAVLVAAGLGVRLDDLPTVLIAAAVVGGVLALFWVAVEDARRRGRSGARWLLGSLLTLPVGPVVYVVVGVVDRSRGRVGIEGRWAPGRRSWVLASLVAALAAAVLVLWSPSVPAQSVTFPGGSGSFEGSCLAPISTAFGARSFDDGPSAGEAPAAQVQAWEAADARADAACAAASSRRLGGGVVLLALATGLALVRGNSEGGRRRRYRPARISIET